MPTGSESKILSTFIFTSFLFFFFISPYDVCEELGWDINQDLEYEVDGDSFILRRAKNE